MMGGMRGRCLAAGVAAMLLLPGCGPFAAGGAEAQSDAQPFAGALATRGAQPTVEGYLADNPHAKLVGASGFVIDGKRMLCGRRPVIIDDKFDSWGGAFPGFLIWNSAMTAKLPTVVRLYIFSHECGHQFVGRDEQAADCFAVRRGVRYGWLNDAGMEQICSFISQLRADDEHAGGAERCAYMRRCLAEARSGN